MRDPKRIDEILKLLEVIWRRNPDWRLGQLVVNVAGDSRHMFSVEDDVMLAALRKAVMQQN